MTAVLALDDAYDVCENITRDQARNFFYGIRLLPREKRDAMCAVYALARRIDDIGDDGSLAPAAQLAELDRLRAELVDIGSSDDPVLVAVADAARRFPIPVDAFLDLVRGVQMDVAGRRYATFDELVEYCRCVAGSVGRLCLGIFGSRPDRHAPEYADALGVALQQTNILRDVREDLLHGRVYLPQDELRDFGVELVLDAEGSLADPDGRLADYLRFAAARAASWYEQGNRLLPLLDRRSAACCGAMAGIYRQLLERIAAQPPIVYQQRTSLSGWAKLAVAARAMSGARG